MAAIITPGYTWASNGQVTNTNLATLVSSATISGVDQTNLASGYGLVITSASSPSNTNALWLDSANSYIPKYYNGSTWTSTAFTPSVSNALSGSIIQVVNTQTGATSSGTTTVPLDDTIPQNTEGDQYMTLAITPNSATNKLKIEVVLFGLGSTDAIVALFQDSTASALAATNFQSPGSSTNFGGVSFTHYMTSGTTSATTFKVRCGPVSASTFYFNGGTGGRLLGGVIPSSITISEIKV